MGRPVIGMLHLPPLPGAPRYEGSLDALNRRVLADAAALVEGGISQLMLENFGDAPFYPAAVPAHVIAHMTALAAEVKRRFDLPLGINVLRNDGCGALSVAHAVGAQFIRVNVLCGARIADQGILPGIAHQLLRLRKRLGAEHIRILADVDVKHSAPLGDPDSQNEVDDLIHRGLADALIVTGTATGAAVSAQQLRIVQQAAGDHPVYVGSGVTAESIGRLSGEADGFIVGSWLKRDGVVSNPVDPDRVRALVQQANQVPSP
ncbi:MAG: BtpA/SgcQ family protein [Planctomycetales bacterium]|nr:BtpA/SgcQ family protein [Planctomycetales bacterium]